MTTPNTAATWREQLEQEIREAYQGILPEEAVEGSIKWWGGFTSRVIEKLIEEERKAWTSGQRCTSCGGEKEDNLADWCGKCFQEN